MKKRVEADLISIAHRILKLKNKSDVTILHTEIKKLYDAITILKFYNDNFDQVNHTVSETDLEAALEVFLDNKPLDADLLIAEDATIIHAELPAIKADDLHLKELLDDPITDLQSNHTSFEPLFEIAAESQFEPIKSSPKEISFEDLIGQNYDGAEFVKPALLELEKKQLLADKLNHGVSITLEDRAGFEQHLFAGIAEDFNRVLSQLSTFDTIDEAKNFIDQIVKPDYDNWTNKGDYEKRFVELIENKFK